MDLTAKISTIMSTDLKTATPEDAVGHINQIFQEYRIHHVPVINGEKKLVGIVSKSDFLYLLKGFTENNVDVYLREAKMRSFKVHEIMAKQVETISENAPIKEAVSILAENRFRCLPVVNEKDRLVGVVTPNDILQHIDRES